MKTLIESLDMILKNLQWFKMSQETKAELTKVVEAEKRSQEAGFQFGGILEDIKA